jgi:DNA-binding response OmpR family regulator
MRMPVATIVLADNDRSSLNTRAEYLEACGYVVLRAADLAQATKYLVESTVNLAILDIRLVNDEDERDVSGITLAEKVRAEVPKIMLTAFPSWQAVRDALGTTYDNEPAATYYVAKREGMEVLLDYVHRAIGKPYS